MLTKTILITALIGALVSPTFAATKQQGTTAVYVNGKLIGAAPDPLIRDMLMRDN